MADKEPRKLPCWLVGHSTTADPDPGTPGGYRETCEKCHKVRSFYVNNTGRHNTSGFVRA